MEQQGSPSLEEPAPLRGKAVRGTSACTLVLASLDEHFDCRRLKADIYLYVHIQTVRLTDRQAGRQADRQTDRQTDRQQEGAYGNNE